MSWNIRVMAHESQSNEEVYLLLHEVYYDKKKIPHSYTANPINIGGEDLQEIRETINKIEEALKKPILWAGEKFPAEWVENNNLT